MPKVYPSNAADEAALLAALRAEASGWEQFTAQFTPLLFSMARRRAPELADDLHEEIVQEVLLALLTVPDSRYLESGKSPASFVGGFVSHAAQRVRATYRAPGVTSRKRSSPGRRPKAAVDESVVRRPDVEIEARIDVARCVAEADTQLRAGILVLLEGGTMREAADAARLPKTSFCRELRKLPLSLRRAA